LPKAEHDADEWQAAMQALLLVAEQDGPTMFARIGIMRALNRNIKRTLTDRKEMHWGKRKLKRDE
jgi:monoamine oxidase